MYWTKLKCCFNCNNSLFLVWSETYTEDRAGFPLVVKVRLIFNSKDWVGL